MPITTLGTTLQSCSLQGVTMTKKFLTAAALAGALIAPTAASAAKFYANKIDCGSYPNCYVLTLDGGIEQGDDVKFDQFLKQNSVNSAVLALNSPGGNLAAGLAIGRRVHESGYATIVPDNMMCGSVCAAIWLAGVPRQYQGKSRIGFHSAYTVDKKGKVIGTTGMGNALLGSYYAHLGLNDMAIAYLTEASGAADQARWLTVGDANKLGIEVKLYEKGKNVIVGGGSKEESPKQRVAPKCGEVGGRCDQTAASNDRFCVSIVEASDEVKADPEFSPSSWLILREGPNGNTKPVGKTGTVGKVMADAVDGEWTHLANRGWVRTKIVQPCGGGEQAPVDNSIG